MVSLESLLGVPEESIFRLFSRACTVSIGVSKGYWSYEFGKPLYRKSEIIILPVRMQLCIEIILLPVRKKLYLVKIDQELYVSSRYRVSE